MPMRLLILSPEELRVPLTGGSQRTGYIAAGLAKRFETIVLLPQSPAEVRNLVDAMPALRAARWLSIWDDGLRRPRTFVDRVRSRIDRWLERRERESWRGAFRDWHIGPLRSWRSAVQAACAAFRPDVAIIEHTRHAATLDYVRRAVPRCVGVINSQNVDSVLHQSLAPSTERPHEVTRFVRRAIRHERRLGRWAHALWTCSDDDTRRYQQIGVRCADIATVPNGIDTAGVEFRMRRQTAVPRILFIGTLCYEPNEEGLVWFHGHVWPTLKAAIPGLRWRIVGRFPTPAIERMAGDDGIELFADAPSTAPHLDESTLFICPLFSGSGTRLKLLEAFSAGIPVVATTVGAEGLNARQGEQLLMADEAAGFARAISTLLEDAHAADRMRRSARKFVESNYDWDIIVTAAAERLAGYGGGR